MKKSRTIAAEALGLRSWAWRHLAGEHETPPPASARAWSLFLRWERCALLIHESVSDAATTLPDHAIKVLRAAATNEMRYILSARAQLRTIAGIAGTLGVRVLVLKGTADVARGRNVLVTDVDVLAGPEDAKALSDALDERGFAPRYHDSIWHLRPRIMPDAIAIEVHTAVLGFETPDEVPWDGTQPIAGYEPLLEPAPHDHAWTILNQAVRKHPERRTRVRDLLMLRRALELAAPDDRAALQRRVDDALQATTMKEMIARACANGSAPDDDAELRLRHVYLMQARVSGESATVRGKIERRATECLAIGSLANWRRSLDPGYASGKSWWRRWAGLLPGHALAMAAAYLMTWDAPWLTPPYTK